MSCRAISQFPILNFSIAQAIEANCTMLTNRKDGTERARSLAPLLLSQPEHALVCQTHFLLGTTIFLLSFAKSSASVVFGDTTVDPRGFPSFPPLPSLSALVFAEVISSPLDAKHACVFHGTIPKRVRAFANSLFITPDPPNCLRPWTDCCSYLR